MKTETTVKQMLSEQVSRLKARDAEYERELEEREEEFQQTLRNAREWLRYCKRANPLQYHVWLAAWLESGQSITHYYEYPSSRWDWLVAKKSIQITPLYGSTSVHLIAPKGISVTGALGHSSVFMMDGPTTDGFCIPCFSDTPAALEALEQRR